MSVSNACEHKEIPTIEMGLPLKLHIDKKVKPPKQKVIFPLCILVIMNQLYNE